MCRKIDLGSVQVSLIEGDSIILIKLLDGITIDVAVAAEIESAICELAEGDFKPILIDTRKALGQLENEAKEYLYKSEKLTAIRKAQAIVVDSLANRLMGTFYIRLFRREIPSKIFSNYDDALDWLKTLI